MLPSMIVGLDLDGTISELPEMFAILASGLLARGHEVHVITYREPSTEDAVREELEGYGLPFTGVHLPGPGARPPEWKARIAQELDLDLMGEDSPEVLARQPEGGRRLWLCDPEIFDLDLCIRALNDQLDETS